TPSLSTEKPDNTLSMRDEHLDTIPVPMPRLMITLVLNQEKSPDLLSDLSHEAFQPSAEYPMMIHRKNTPILDVPLFHFYPP
nr:hypothetical protein [Tanacetum cinerariifolium]